MSGLAGLAGWVADVIAEVGWIGVGALTLLENLFPPVPSEVVLPLAGFAAQQGHGALVVMILAATAGSVAGAVVLYEGSAALGLARVLRWAERTPGLRPHQVERAVAWFAGHGPRAVLVGRCVPLVRSLVSVPAAVAGMRRSSFLVLTAVGSLAWNTAWIVGGYALGTRWHVLAAYADGLDLVLVAALLLIALRGVVRRRRG